MRRIRYSVAASLDGYIAGPKGEADRTVMSPGIDFTAIWTCRRAGLTGMIIRHTETETMPSAKIAITNERDLLSRLDRLVKEQRLPSRSRAVQEALRDKLDRLDRSR